MRYSTQPTDPGHTAWLKDRHWLTKAKFFLNNSEQKDVVTVDTEHGVIVVYARDSEGRLMIEGGELRTSTFFGQVRIEASQ